MILLDAAHANTDGTRFSMHLCVVAPVEVVCVLSILSHTDCSDSKREVSR